MPIPEGFTLDNKNDAKRVVVPKGYTLDEAPHENESLLSRIGGRIKDTAIDAAKGVVGLGESVVGAADLLTGNLAGNALEAVGYDPKETHRILDSGYSAARQQANANVQQASGFMDTLGALVDNPSVAFGTIVQSAPLSIGSAAAARTVAVRMLAKAGIQPGTAAATRFFADPKVQRALVAASSGTEGAMTAGSIQEQGRQEGRSYTQTALPAVAAGIGTGAIGAASSKIPGFKDAEATAAIAGLGGTRSETLRASGKEIGKSMVKEGLFEELPQSAQEQVFTNMALGKPVGEGVGSASAQGLVAGMAQGGGMTAVSEMRSVPAGPLTRAVASADPATVGPPEFVPAPEPISGMVAQSRGERGKRGGRMVAPSQPVTTPLSANSRGMNPKAPYIPNFTMQGGAYESVTPDEVLPPTPSNLPAKTPPVYDTEAAPVAPTLTAEQQAIADTFAANPTPVNRAAWEEVQRNLADPVLAEQMARGREVAAMPSRAAAPASSLSSLISQARNRVPTLPASGIEGVTNEAANEGRQDERQYTQGTGSYADAEGNGQNAQAGLPQRGDGEDAQDERGVAANLPEPQQNTDAQIPPVAGLSEPVDTQVSPEKGEEGAKLPPSSELYGNELTVYHGSPNEGIDYLDGNAGTRIQSFYPTADAAANWVGAKHVYSAKINVGDLWDYREKADAEALAKHLYENNAKGDSYEDILSDVQKGRPSIIERGTDWLKDNYSTYTTNEQGNDAIHQFKGGQKVEPVSPSPPSPKVEAPAPVGGESVEVAAPTEPDFALILSNLEKQTAVEKGKGNKGHWSVSDFQEYLKESYPTVAGMPKARVLSALRTVVKGKPVTGANQEVIDAFRHDEEGLRQKYGNLAEAAQDVADMFADEDVDDTLEFFEAIVKRNEERGKHVEPASEAEIAELFGEVPAADAKPDTQEGISKTEGNPYRDYSAEQIDNALGNFAQQSDSFKKWMRDGNKMTPAMQERYQFAQDRISALKAEKTRRNQQIEESRKTQAKAEVSQTGTLTITKAERKQVMQNVGDVYKDSKAPREIKGFDRNGNEIFGYVYSPEYFVKSDLSGKPIRHYVTLPDGSIAHPDEIHEAMTRGRIRIVNESEATDDAGGWRQEVAVSAAKKVPTIGGVQKQGGRRESTSDLMDAFTPEAPSLYSTTDNAPHADLTLERVRSSFPTLPVTEDNGTFTVTTPSGIPIRISKVGEIEFGPDQRAAAEKEYGRKLRDDERPAAEFKPLDHGAIINLTERGIGELDHESFHAAMSLALTEKQKAAVLRTFGNEEKAAAEYQRLKDSGALEGKRGNYWLSKIYRFLRALRQLISPTAKGVMEDVASGKMWGKAHAGDGGARYAAQRPRTEGFREFIKYSKVKKIVYHATINSFDTFDTSLSDLGAHFGTEEQANNVARYRYGNGEGINIVPVWLNIVNPLRLKDVGTFHADGIADQLEKKGLLPKGEGRRIIKEIDRDWKLRKKYDPMMREAIEKAGYDGIVYKNTAPHEGDGDSYIVFHPEQVKSAIGNNGDFDPANPDIRYSLRSAFTDHNPAALKSALTTHPHVQAMVYSAIKSGRNIPYFMRGIGTMYHRAEVLAKQGKPQFKRVFDKGQEFLTDNTTIALQAESMAPDIFPKMGTWKGVFKNLPKKEARAIAEPLFQGTLYGGADPKKGKVFTDLELRRIFKMNDKQIDLYRQARAAVDQSLDDMAKALIAKNAKQGKVGFDRDMDLADMAQEVADAIQSKVDDMRAALQQAEDDFANTPPKPDPKDQKKAQKAHDRFVRDQEAAIELNESLVENVKDIAAKTTTLKKRGYFPLMRFGDYTVTMRDAKGDVEYFGMFESNFKAQLQKIRMQKQHPGKSIVLAPMSKGKFQIYEGLNVEALQLFAEHINKEDSAAYQEYLKVAMHNRSAMKRLIHRKGTAGFSEDAIRTLASFIVSNARHASTQYHMHDMKQLVEAIPEDQGDVKDMANDLVEYLSKPREEASKLRGILFYNYLGGSLASGVFNMTQPLMTTAPYLATKTSVANAVKHINLAAKIAFTDPAKVQGELGIALRRAEREGVTAPQEIYQLIAMASNKLLAANTVWNAGLKVWGSFFSVAEAFNRRVTFTAAFRISRENGLSTGEAYDEASKAITETQFLYNKGNRPKWARGIIGAPLFTFKQFGIMYGELFLRLPAKQRTLMIGLLWFMAGLQGMPFAEDVEDIIDTIGQWTGHATNSKRALDETAQDLLGEGAGKFLTHGASSVLPLDLSRLGFQNLIPGTAMLKQSEIDKGKDVKEIFGAAGGLLDSLLNALSLAAQGLPGRAAIAASPRAIQNAAQGVEAWATGAAHDKYGRKTVKMDKPQAVLKGLGFNPSSAAEESMVKSANYQDVNLLRVRKQEIVNQWAYGIANKDRGEIAEAKRKLVEWNRKNPELKMTLGSVVQSARQKSRALQTTGKERFIKSMPKEIRKRVIDELG